MNKKTLLILSLASLVFASLFTLLNVLKYQNFHYNALDLAIIHQVFYNSSLGNFFASSIHPQTYLKDHVSPIIFLLLPFYSLFKHPITLLALQNIALVSSVFPLFLIAKKYFSEKISAFLALSWLFMPMVQNLSMFEFSFLSFSLPFLFWAWHSIKQNKFLPALIFSLLALLAREDVSLVIFMYGFFCFLGKKNWRLGISLAALSVAYFFFSMKLISFNNPDGYKFFVYYSYLGQNIFEIIKYLLLHPIFLLAKFFSLGNIEMILGMLLPFAFLPILKPKYLALSALIYLQIFLGSGGASGLILKTQYAALFLPALFLSYLESLAHARAHTFNSFIEKYLKKEKLGLMIVILAVLYSSLLLGPVAGAVQKHILGRDAAYNQKRLHIVRAIPPNAPVAASYDTLPRLSGRKNISAINYGFIGKEQFGKKSYEIPKDTEYILLNLSDFVSYELQYRDDMLYSDTYFSGDDRVRNFIQENELLVEDIFDDHILFSKNGKNAKLPYAILKTAPKMRFALNKKFNNLSELLGYNISQEDDMMVLELFWQTQKPLEKNFFLKILALGEKNKTIWEKIIPLASGLYPPHEWKLGEIIQINYWFYIPSQKLKKVHNIAFEAIEILEGGIYIDSDRSTKNFIGKTQSLGGVIIEGF